MPEPLLHETAEEAAHRMRLSPGLGNNVVDGGAGLPPQHLDHQALLAFRSCSTPLEAGRRHLLIFAMRLFGCRLALTRHTRRGLSGLGVFRVNAEGEKAGIDEQAKRTAILVTAPFRGAIDDVSLFGELSLAQGLDDPAERGAFDAYALRKGEKRTVRALRRCAQDHKLAVAELDCCGLSLWHDRLHRGGTGPMPALPPPRARRRGQARTMTEGVAVTS